MAHAEMLMGRLLREAREAAGLTQLQVALRAGGAEGFGGWSSRVSRMELGRGLRFPMLLKFCEAVGVKPSTLFAEMEDALQGA